MAEAEGGSEQDDVSFLRTVRIYTRVENKNKNKAYRSFRLNIRPCIMYTGRYGVPLLYGNRRARLFGCRRIRQSTLFSREHCRQKCTARFVAMRFCHRASAVSSSAPGISHGCWLRNRKKINDIFMNIFMFYFVYIFNSYIHYDLYTSFPKHIYGQ